MTQTDASPANSWIPVQRVVFPSGDDLTVLPLYLDWRSGSTSSPSGASKAVPFKRVPTQMERGAIVVPEWRRLSLAAYFNAFPAAYWRQWTDATAVRLVLEIDQPAAVDVFVSSARGTYRRIDGADGVAGALEFEISLTSFGDGGWVWFEVEAGATPVRVSDAQWLVPRPLDYRPGRAAVAVTTFNRPADCVDQMKRFANAPDLMSRLSQLIITDQGTKAVADAAGYGEAAAALGEQFRLICQPNLGGSGGFSRGMLEGLAGGADYVLLLDDDVVIEPEGILRSVQFADFSRRPTIVGGHMFSLYERSMMHSFGEAVNFYTFEWGVGDEALKSLDFGSWSLRAVPQLHQRLDVDYTGWWMCLIPRQVIERIGLSLPVFIKWDDAEYAIRAKAAGFPTVTLPGACVWHVPWTDKSDGLDWQAYFHKRNRWVAALLHSPYEHGGGFPRLSFATDVRHLISMQYSTVALHVKALEDVLAGPEHMIRGLPTINADVRRLRSGYVDAQVLTEVADYPEVSRARPLPRGRQPEEPRSLAGVYFRAVGSALRAVRRVPESSLNAPGVRVPAAKASWWLLGVEDSALVSTPDGAGATLYLRNRMSFWELLSNSIRLHVRLYVAWTRLSRSYRSSLSRVVSPEEWRTVFD